MNINTLGIATYFLPEEERVFLSVSTTGKWCSLLRGAYDPVGEHSTDKPSPSSRRASCDCDYLAAMTSVLTAQIARSFTPRPRGGVMVRATAEAMQAARRDVGKAHAT
jgi:hypothetical protein